MKSISFSKLCKMISNETGITSSEVRSVLLTLGNEVINLKVGHSINLPFGRFSSKFVKGGMKKLPNEMVVNTEDSVRIYLRSKHFKIKPTDYNWDYVNSNSKDSDTDS